MMVNFDNGMIMIHSIIDEIKNFFFFCSQLDVGIEVTGEVISHIMKVYKKKEMESTLSMPNHKGIVLYDYVLYYYTKIHVFYLSPRYKKSIISVINKHTGLDVNVEDSPLKLRYDDELYFIADYKPHYHRKLDHCCAGAQWAFHTRYSDHFKNDYDIRVSDFVVALLYEKYYELTCENKDDDSL